MNPVVLCLTAMIAVALASRQGYYQCEPCSGEECNIVPSGCKYRTTRNACGRLVCMAGPGQKCGGRDNHLGKCGSGMACKCGKCRGCSIDRLYEGVIECDNNNAICS